jgi:hypothetical protein
MVSENIYKSFHKHTFQCLTWSNPTAVSLTLKQRNSENWKLTDEIARKELRHLLNRLGRKFFGNQHRRKRLRRFVVWERGHGGGLHLHMAIDRPTGISIPEFEHFVISVWISLEWGRKECEFKEIVDEGWMNYILKNRSKDSLDWSVDLENSVAE